MSDIHPSWLFGRGDCLLCLADDGCCPSPVSSHGHLLTHLRLCVVQARPGHRAEQARPRFHNIEGMSCTREKLLLPVTHAKMANASISDPARCYCDVLLQVFSAAASLLQFSSSFPCRLQKSWTARRVLKPFAAP